MNKIMKSKGTLNSSTLIITFFMPYFSIVAEPITINGVELSYKQSLCVNIDKYYNCERIPGTSPINATRQGTSSWVNKHWHKDPIFMKKKAITFLDKEVLPMQNNLIKSINGLKGLVEIACEEYCNRGIVLEPINDIFNSQKKLMISKDWRKLYQIDRGARGVAQSNIKRDINKLLLMIDKLFISINKNIQTEYAVWAQQNPASAQQIALMRKISALEKQTVVAKQQAAAAAMAAEEAEASAAAAFEAADNAYMQAEEASRRARDADMRAYDAYWHPQWPR